MGDSLTLNSGGYIIVCKGGAHKSDRKSVIAVVATSGAMSIKNYVLIPPPPPPPPPPAKPPPPPKMYIYVALTQKYNDLIWS